MKVLVFGDNSSSNLGDPILTNSAAYIAKQLCKSKLSVQVKVFDIVGREKQGLKQNNISKQNENLINKLRFKLRPVLIIAKWYLKDINKFEKKLLSETKDSSEIIFLIAGGALISSSLVYATRLKKIVSFAKKRNISVIFNAIGIEKSVKKGLSKFFIRKMLKSPNIKGFATRDNIEDIIFLTNKKEFFKKNCDPGIFAAETYNVSKKESNTVGIGVISVEAYNSIIHENKKSAIITEDSLIEFWYSIIVELEKNNVEWKLFTNGGEKDYNIACKLIEKYSYSKEKLLPQPKQPIELVEQIASFSVVVAHRLHALIIATSLRVPIIPIVWSSKVLEFAKELGIDELAVWPEKENVPIILQKLLDKNFVANDKKISKLKNQANDFLKNEFSNLEILNND